MTNKTLDQFTLATAKPAITSLVFLRDPTLAAPRSRSFTLQLLMETMQDSLTVKSMALSTPVALAPSVGDRYVVMATGSGAWAGEDNNIAVYDGSSWMFATPSEGWTVYDQNANIYQRYDGSAWGNIPAASIGYDNSTSNLSAAQVQAALDEIMALRRYDVTITPFGSGSAVTVGNGTIGVAVPATMNGMNVIGVLCSVHDKGITGQTDVQVRRRRAGADVDVLSTKVTIGDEFFARDGVVNASNDDLATGDILYVDVDAIHSGTAPNGLSVTITAKLP